MTWKEIIGITIAALTSLFMLCLLLASMPSNPNLPRIDDEQQRIEDEDVRLNDLEE